MSSKKVLLLLLLFSGVKFIYAMPPLEEGKAIFSSRCAACHNVNKTLTGPALAGVDQRRSIDWIIKFVRSSQTLVKNGDKDAVAIFNQFNNIPMPDHPDLTEENIKSIVEYIRSEAKTVSENKAPFAKPGKLVPPYKPLSLEKDYHFFLIYLALVVLLIMVLLVAVKVRSISSKSIG